MKGTYRVRKDNLKLLHKEARINASQFDSFSIHRHRNIERLFSDLLSVAMSILGGREVKEDLVSTSIPSKFIDRHYYGSLICVCFFVIFILVPLMVWILYLWEPPLVKIHHLQICICILHAWPVMGTISYDFWDCHVTWMCFFL